MDCWRPDGVGFDNRATESAATPLKNTFDIYTRICYNSTQIPAVEHDTWVLHQIQRVPGGKVVKYMAEMVGAPMGGSEITQEDKSWSLWSWIIWPVALIALLMEDKKNRPFIKYNAVQALALNVVAWGSSVIGIGVCLGPLAFIYGIILGLKANKGERVNVPVITDFCKKQGWIS